VPRGTWVYVGERAGHKPPAAEKADITARCERFIAETLRPRFLPVVRPTEFNYPIAIHGNWHGNKYRFVTRYRSDRPDSLEPEFDAPFARIGYVNRDCLDLSWHRHTGEWFGMYQRLTLDEALHRIETEPYFHVC
jgi:hypothetical protein